MQHIFYGQEGYEPTFYGKDINWKYWPIKDNEVRWMLHRHKWFIPMGYAYRASKDEKYAKEWAFQYMDWIKKNPLLEIPKEEYEILDNSTLQDEAENNRFAWRPLEVSDRLQAQLIQFLLFLPAQSFTPEFLTEFCGTTTDMPYFSLKITPNRAIIYFSKRNECCMQALSSPNSKMPPNGEKAE